MLCVPYLPVRHRNETFNCSPRRNETSYSQVKSRAGYGSLVIAPIERMREEDLLLGTILVHEDKRGVLASEDEPRPKM